MLPILGVPILIGGISGKDCLMALLIDGTVLLLGLSAGLLASAFSRDWIRSFVVAEILSLCFVYAFMVQHAAFLSSLTAAPFAVFGGSSFASQVMGLFSFHANIADEQRFWIGAPVIGPTGPIMSSAFTGRWNGIWAMGPSVQSQWFLCMFGCLAGGFALLLLSVGLAARKVALSWREEPAPRKLVKIRKAFTTPIVAVRTLRSHLRRSLDRNPIGWLQHYSWSGRITKWSWFAVIIMVESFLIADFWDFDEMQPGHAVILFQLTVLAMFFSVPVIGLFMSLHTTHFLPAWLWTMALGVGVPCFAFGREPTLQLIVLYVEGGLGLLAWLFLRDNLTERKFIIRA
jgi:hypothetical protein